MKNGSFTYMRPNKDHNLIKDFTLNLSISIKKSKEEDETMNINLGENKKLVD